MKRFTLAVLAAALAAPAFAQDAVLARISGPVSVLAEGGKRFVKAGGGEQLLFGDTIRVGKGGIAHLTLGDRGAVLLREETLLTLQGSPRRAVLAVTFGEFLVGLRKKLEAGESFKVRTPAAVAAVRGTLFWGRSDKKDQSTTYAGFGSVVAVRARGKTVLVEPGNTVTVPFGEAPSDPAPSKVGLAYANNFAIDDGIQGLGDLAEVDKLGK
jgi:hypothetical protein